MPRPNRCAPAAHFHAAFWNHPLLQEDIVCKGDPDACAIFFEQWGRLACTTEGAWEAYVDAAKKPPVSFDMSPTERDQKAVRLMKAHTEEMFAAFHKVLDNRPAKTLTHGDMRGDNMFKKDDGSGFTVIDWQTYGASTPGVEMHQVSSGLLRPFLRPF
jgi:thiamine kinase-like enzyme